MPRSSERGIVHILVLLILLGGIIAGVYLITNGNPLKLFSRAASGPIDPTPSPTPSLSPSPSSSPSPSPSQPPQLPLTLTANPTSLNISGSVTLTWNIVGSATSCSLSRGSTAGTTMIGSWGGVIKGSDVTSGSHSRLVVLTNTSPVNKTLTFNMSCKMGTTTKTASANVVIVPAIKPSVTLSASPTTVNSGGSTTLSWNITGGLPTTCSLTHSGNASLIGSWNGTIKGADVTLGIHTRSITLSRPTTGLARTRTFNISCINTGGKSSTSSVKITVQ